MKQYLQVLQHILDTGVASDDRTGIGTLAVVDGTMTKYNLKDGFPAVTTKQLAWKSLRGEFLWMMQGKTSDKELSLLTHGEPGKRTIWTDNYEKQGKDLGYEDGELGAVYGHQLRNFEGVTFKGTRGVSIDQLAYIIKELKNNPTSRRAHFSYWNPCQVLDEAALPPCHLNATFNIQNNKLYCTMLMRSNDAFLGEPFNIAFYALLMHCLAIILNVEVGVYTHVVVNHHIYTNHLDQVKEQLTREPMHLPTLVISDAAKELLQTKGVEAFDYLTIEDFQLDNYKHHPKLTAPMAV